MLGVIESKLSAKTENNKKTNIMLSFFEGIWR